MAGDRKRRKVAGGGTDSLTQLLHVGGVSTIGLSQLLEKLRGVDLSELAASRYHLRAKLSEIAAHRSHALDVWWHF